MSRGAGRLMPPGGADPPLDGQTPVYEPTGADPRIAPGLDRPPGSIARFGVSTYLQKTGTAPTAWGTWAAGGAIFSINAGGTNDATANAIGRVLFSGFGISISATGSQVLFVNQAASEVNILDKTGGNNIVGISTASSGARLIMGQGGIELGFATTNGTLFYVTANPLRVSYMVNNGYDRGVFIGDISNGTIHVAPLHVGNPISATRADQIMNVSNSASAGATITMRLGLYTMSGSTASQASSTSRVWSYASNLASSSYTQVSGTRYRSMALGTWNMTPGDYMMAVQWSVATALTSGTHQPHGGRDISIDADEYQLGLGSRARYWNGGMFTAVSAALPASFHLTDIGQSGSNDVIFTPFLTFAGTF